MKEQRATRPNKSLTPELPSTTTNVSLWAPRVRLDKLVVKAFALFFRRHVLKVRLALKQAADILPGIGRAEPKTGM